MWEGMFDLKHVYVYTLEPNKITSVCKTINLTKHTGSRRAEKLNIHTF